MVLVLPETKILVSGFYTIDHGWTKCFLPQEKSFKLKISLHIPYILMLSFPQLFLIFPGNSNPRFRTLSMPAIDLLKIIKKTVSNANQCMCSEILMCVKDRHLRVPGPRFSTRISESIHAVICAIPLLRESKLIRVSDNMIKNTRPIFLIIFS